MVLEGELIIEILNGGRWYNVGLPLVTLKLLRGTTALEVKAPPVHCRRD
jgi:hypothetical protein